MNKVRNQPDGIKTDFRQNKDGSESTTGSNQHQLYEEIKKYFIGCPRSFLTITGNHKAAILLHQICYWCDIHSSDEIFLEQKNWYKQLMLTEKEVQRALSILKEKKLVSTSVGRVKGKTITFYKIDWVQLRSLCFEIEECYGSDIPPKGPKRGKGKAAKMNDKLPLSMDKKSIPESTIRHIPYEWTKSTFLNYSSEVNYSNLSPIKEELQQNLNKSSANTDLAPIELNEKGYPSDWDDLGQNTKNSLSH